jgi:hypothetical protein
MVAADASNPQLYRDQANGRNLKGEFEKDVATNRRVLRYAQPQRYISRNCDYRLRVLQNEAKVFPAAIALAEVSVRFRRCIGS